MMLDSLVLLPFFIALWLLWRPGDSHPLAFAGAAAECLIAALIWLDPHTATSRSPTVPLLGSLWYLQDHGVAAVLALCVALLLPVSLVVAWRDPHFPTLARLLLVLEGALMGTLFSQNFLGFYAFYEILALAGAWLVLRSGAKDRQAALTFLLYTVTASLFLLLAVIALYLRAGQSSGVYSFDYLALMGAGNGAPWALLGFAAMILGLGVKLPLFPLHGWAPRSYRQASPAASLFLSGAAVLAGVYGWLHWAIPLLPQAALQAAPWGMGLAAAGTLYAALVALDSPDLPGLIAWSSVSHMNLVALGLFAMQDQGVTGALFLAVAHALLAGGLFALLALFAARGLSTRWDDLGGLFRRVPQWGAWMLLFFLMAAGLPGLGNFPGEFLTLIGGLQSAPWPAAVATLALVLNIVLFLRAYERSMLGKLNPQLAHGVGDLSHRERWLFWALGVGALWLGLDSQALLSQLPVALPVIHGDIFAGVWYGH